MSWRSPAPLLLQSISLSLIYFAGARKEGTALARGETGGGNITVYTAVSSVVVLTAFIPVGENLPSSTVFPLSSVHLFNNFIVCTWEYVCAWVYVRVCVCIHIHFNVGLCVHFDLNWKHITTISYRLRALFWTANVIRIQSCLKITPSIFSVLIRSDLGNSGKEFKLPSNPSPFFLPSFTKVWHVCESFSLCSAHFFVLFTQVTKMLCPCPRTRL